MIDSHNYEIIIALIFIYSTHNILYKRTTPLGNWEIFTLFCTAYWIYLILDHLQKIWEHRKNNPLPSPPNSDEYGDHDRDGIIINPN